MIRMYGNIVQICKYRIDFIDEHQNKFSEYAITEQEANNIAKQTGGAVTALDTSSENWLDGMTFSTRDEALNWLEKGESAYNDCLTSKKTQENNQLRADLDFLSIMMGVTL